MEVNLYTVYDVVAEEAGPLFNAKNDNIAIRKVCNMLKEMAIEEFDDYELILVGVYDTEKPQIILVEGEVKIDYKPFMKRKLYDRIGKSDYKDSE